MSIFTQTGRRAALKTMGGAVGGGGMLLALNSGSSVLAQTGAAAMVPGTGQLADLGRRLAAIPRRRDFSTVPFMVTHPEQWDQAAAELVLAYRYRALQMWENSELGGPWLNLMREAMNGQVFAHGHRDFLAVSATHGTAHLALFAQPMWDKYRLGALTGGKFIANTFAGPHDTVSPRDDPQDLAGYYGPGNNTIATLQQRGAVFIACHDSIHAIARGIHANADFAGISPDVIAADLTNHLIPDAVLVPSVVAFIVELQRVGFTYSKGT